MADNGFKYSHEQIGERVWCVVEDDPYGQYPFLYVLLGDDKCIVIDTGTGANDFKTYVSLFINHVGLPYLIINTHVHFDHVGGNYAFSEEKDCLGICMGSRKKDFIEKRQLNSLAMGHSILLRDFKVTRWLEEGDFIFFDDSNPQIQNSLQVIFTSGHTPDSIALYSHRDNRLFIGDYLYPFAAIHADCLGSSLVDYENTLLKLLDFTEPLEDPEEARLEREEKEREQKEKAEREQKEKEEREKREKEERERKEKEQQQQPKEEDAMAALKKTLRENFLETIGLNPLQEPSLQFDLNALLNFCDWAVSSAVEMYFENPDYVTQCFPRQKPPPVSSAPSASDSSASSTPAPASSSAPASSPSDKEFSRNFRISCGHVESKLKRSALVSLQELLAGIRSGAICPSSITDDKYAEYTNGHLTILTQLNDPWFQRHQ